MSAIDPSVRDREAPVPSPCISICRMNPAIGDEPGGLCEGCMRSLSEIAAWSMADNRTRRAIWERIERRRAILTR